MEQPREPKFYPNEVSFSAGTSGNAEKTLQSIDGTLKRNHSSGIEKPNFRFGRSGSFSTEVRRKLN